MRLKERMTGTSACRTGIVCSRCGRTIAFDPGLIEGAFEAIRRETGFEVDPAHNALGGRCAECAAEERA